MSLWRRLSKTKHFRVNRFKYHLLRPLTVIAVFAMIGSTLIYFSFAQRYGGGFNEQLPAGTYIAPNPTIVSQSCLGGINIAILADVSGSVYKQENMEPFYQMQTALKDFVTSLLPSTRTNFSVTQFSSGATVLRPMSNNVTSITSGIDDLRGPGSTDWTAGLDAAYSTFPTDQAGVPNMLLIATDGDPTEPQGSAITSAVTKANAIKQAGVHILALGVGGSPKVENLSAISGTNVNTGGVNTDVITTSFEAMNAALQNLSRSTCSSGGNGSGIGGNGNGTGGTGNGTGTGGTGNGSNGAGFGTVGSGTGTSGRGKGLTGAGVGSGVGTTPQPSPTPTPTATQGTTPSPSPTPTPDADPTPAPTATLSTEPTTNPAPTPTAQGVKVKPPDPQPSPFYDGKQYAPGSTPDTMSTAPTKRTSYVWLYITVPTVLAGIATGIIVWRKRSSAKVPQAKPKAAAKKRR